MEEYLLENGLYDDADCIMDETLYIVFDYYALDEKASRFQAILSLPEKERKDALLTAIGLRKRLF